LRRELSETVVLALPVIAAQLTGVGMTFVDAMLAGHLSAHTLGAVGVGANTYALAFITSLGLMMAVPPSVAQLAGANRHGDIGALFRQALWLAAAIGAVLVAALYFLGPRLLGAIGVAEGLRDETTAFLHAIAWGIPALTGYFALRGVSEGVGLTRPSMYFGLFALVLLAPIGYVLMYGKLGIAPMGAAGAGAATAIVLWLQFLGLATWVRLRPEYARLNLFAQFDRPSAAAIGELLRIGVPMGFTVLMEAGLFAAAALSLAKLGETTAASHQVALNVASIAFMIPLGLAMAITVRVGHAVGRGDATGVRYAGFVGIGLAFATQVVATSLMFAFPQTIVGLYTSDAAVTALASQLLVLAGIFQFSDGVQVASNGALRGLKDTRVPMVITVLAYWAIGMPIGWWLTFEAGYGARGMWIGLIAGLSVAAVLLFLRFWREARTESWRS
jgi:MATE family multidrug resistance protein